MDTFLSIVIPTYNRANIIARTVCKILEQPFKSFEIIVVDDGSQDNTFDVIKNICDDRLRYFKIKNGERGRARNYGASLANGKYINFFDSDDIFLVDLTKLYNFMVLNYFPPVVFGKIEIENKINNTIYAPRQPYKSFTKNLLFDNFLACGSVFLKKEVALEFPFNEERLLSSAEDWELWLRIHSKYKFQEFPSTVFRLVEHSQRSLTTVTPQKVEQRDSYFAKEIKETNCLCNAYGARAIKLFMADRFTFIALTYIVAGDKEKAYKYWLKSLVVSLEVTKRKRFWAVLKKFIIVPLNTGK